MDEAKWSAQRLGMVLEQLRARGVEDDRVLDALALVPRERFVPDSQKPHACADRALSIGHGQTISQPFMVGFMTEALRVQPGHRVLEVGTGSGYQTAVLAVLGACVYSVERVFELVETARDNLQRLDLDRVVLRRGDGSLGWPEEQPFDRIIVTAAAPEVPPTLLAQMSSDGGRLVVPVGPRDLQELVVVERVGNDWVTETLLECRFVPLVGTEGWDH